MSGNEMRVGILAIAVATTLAGCGQNAAVPAPVQATAKPISAAQAKTAKANELGQVPVIMYHRIVDKPGTQDDRTPAQFRVELERLAREGYVPVTAAEYVSGTIGIPAGKHPVVLTFDDASPSQVTLNGQGVPAPGTAVAILREVAAAHPGFRPVATFYVTRDMFGKTDPAEQAMVLGWLRQNGFDLGNHTRDHLNLLGKSQSQVMTQIAGGHKEIVANGGGTPVTLALPYGNQPRKHGWALKGKSGGTSYTYGGVFLAGYTPAASPFSKEFDPAGIPRIRAMDKKGDCSQFCSTAWLDYLKAHPDERYTSDGDVRTVAVPAFQKAMIAKTYLTKALAY